MPVELSKYTLATGWEFVRSYGEGKITAQIEEDVRKQSAADLWGFLLRLSYSGDSYTWVYFHDGGRLVHPPILKEQTLPEPTLAQKFLAGIPDEVLQRVGNAPLKERLQEMIIQFATDDAHEVYPLEFFSEGIMDLAGGADAPEFEGYTLTSNDFEDLDDREEFEAWEDFPDNPGGED